MWSDESSVEDEAPAGDWLKVSHMYLIDYYSTILQCRTNIFKVIYLNGYGVFNMYFRTHMEIYRNAQ